MIATTCTVGELIDLFIEHKRSQRRMGDITQATLNNVLNVLRKLHANLGDKTLETIGPNDFLALRQQWMDDYAPTTVQLHITLVKEMFRYGQEDLDLPGPRYGQAFKAPTAKSIRQARHAKPRRLFKRREILGLLEVASPRLKAMILLGLNCGFGVQDCALLPRAAVKIRKGWVNYPRPKTAVERTCPLWPATKTALSDYLDSKNSGPEHLFFASSYGVACTQQTMNRDFRLLTRSLGMRRKYAFYAFRHVFETVASGCRDQIAVAHIMGHVQRDMGAAYREQISGSRLRRAVNHVHKWLFNKPAFSC